MRLRRLRVLGFGSLKGDFIFSSDRCNLILEPNESGKSTLAAALLAVLYGMPRQRATRDAPMPPRERHRPWSGDAYAVELEMQRGDGSYIVRRDFERDTTEVFDAVSGRDITAEFSRGRDQVAFGEAILGMSREDFMRCCFVGQRDIDRLSDPGSLTHTLQRLASSQKGDIAAGEAIAALTRAVDRDYEGMRLGKGKVDTEIRRLEKEIEELRAEIDGIASRRRESEEKIRRLEETTLREGQAEAQLARVDGLCLLAARQEVRSALQECAREEQELGAWRAEAETLAPWAAFPADRLGELRELKGRIESLQAGRSTAQRKLLEEVEQPLEAAERSLAGVSGLAAVSAREASLAADRQAVMTDLWEQRRAKRRALRKEERALRAAGIEPARIKELAAAFGVLSEDDRRYLAAYRETMLEARASLSEAERVREKLGREDGGDGHALASMVTARRTRRIALVVGPLGMALAALLWVSFPLNKLPAILALLGGIAGFIYWIRLQEKRPVPGAEQFGSDLQRVQTEVWAREKEMAGLQERLLGIASRMSRSSPDAVLREHRELETLQEKGAPLAAVAASLAEIQARYDAATGELLALMQRAGETPRWPVLTPRGARRFREKLDRFLVASEKTAALRAALDTGVKELSDIVLEIETLRGRFRDACAAAGLEDGGSGGDLSAALERFAAAAARRERLDRLRTEILPAAERRHAAPPAERAAALERELEILTRQVEKALRQLPDLAGVTPERSSREYADERRRVQEEIRAAQRDRLALAEELGDVLKEYRKEYPGRVALLASLESAHGKAVAFREAVSIATDVLSAISREAYAEWADVLNEKTGEILRRLCPGYEDVRFDTDLSFSLREARGGRRLDQAAIDAQLSAGTRDQIYLAVRMAVSEYLSAAGARLPLILDDPFTAFDDQRFERAMEFLLSTVARRHQVIILSCHEARHRAWQERAPAHLADSVRVLGLTPLST